jgi:hypothetical protein
MRRKRKPTPAPADETPTITTYLTPMITFAYGHPPRVYKPGDRLTEDDPIVAKVGKASFYRVIE